MFFSWQDRRTVDLHRNYADAARCKIPEITESSSCEVYLFSAGAVTSSVLCLARIWEEMFSKAGETSGKADAVASLKFTSRIA